MDINCPQCNKEVVAADLNMEHMVGKCIACNHVFNFASQVGATPTYETKSQLNAPKPEKVTRENDGFDLVLRWRWYNHSILILIPFAIFWNAIVFTFIGFGTFFAFGAGEGFPGPFGFFPLFALPHFLIGIWLIYQILTTLLNQTAIRISSSELSVRHFPLPWLGAKTVPAAEVDQLYTKERISGKRGTKQIYEVHMIDRNSTHRKIVSGLDTSEHALYIEQEIEEYLGIKNRLVRGEYG